MWKPDADAIRKDMADAAAARARGEKWCWRCARRAEQFRPGPCEDCAINIPADASEKQRRSMRRVHRKALRQNVRTQKRNVLITQMHKEMRERAAQLVAEMNPHDPR
jgi:hypothetical protein